eukprot:Em0001g4a
MGFLLNLASMLDNPSDEDDDESSHSVQENSKESPLKSGIFVDQPPAEDESNHSIHEYSKGGVHASDEDSTGASYCGCKTSDNATGEKGGFCCHEASGCHNAAVEAVVTLPKMTGDIGELLSSAHAKKKASNRKNLMTVAECLMFVARQGLAIRGDGDEMDSNFYQLLLLRGIDNVTIRGLMAKKQDKEQVVGSDFEPHEDFVGLHKVDKVNADMLVAGHALNLAAADVVKQSHVIRDVLDKVGEINKLLKYSPKRDSLFEQLKSSVSPGTVGSGGSVPRWTELWDEARHKKSDSENRVRKAQMEKFDFLFGLCRVLLIAKKPFSPSNLQYS